MRILYGVVGEGMGHATRSRVVLDHLAQDHDVRVMVSGRAHGFLAGRYADHPRVTVREIAGLHLVYEDNAVKSRASLRSNLRGFVPGYRQNLTAYRRTLGDFMPEVVITDFESFAGFFARKHRIPLISLDNMQVIQRCQHDRYVTDDKCPDFRVARLAVKAKLPRCDHYLITSFFFPPPRKKRTTLAPPILREVVLEARRDAGEHILVYQTSDTNTRLIPELQKLPYEFRLYGMKREERLGNVQLRDFSEVGFVSDLASARGVIAGGGFSLMGEAVHLQVPMLSVPLEGQYEQEINARYLQQLGYGRFASELTPSVVQDFLEGLPAHAEALKRYVPQDNGMLFGLIDELLERIDLGERRIPSLMAPSMGGT